MIISIGILAYNESLTIGNLFTDLQKQTLFRRKDLQFKLYVVPNGCTDNTTEVAQALIDQLEFKTLGLQCVVHTIVEKGKPNAWNRFVHQIVDPQSDYIIMMDADVRIIGEQSLELLLDALISDPRAVVAVGEPMKDVALQANPSLSDRVILAFTRTENNYRDAVSGGMYCARFKNLRQIQIPVGHLSEDGLIRAFLLTDNFHAPEDLGRLRFVPNAKHTFETLRSLSKIFHHQVRLTMGTSLNNNLIDHLRAVLPRERDLGAYIQRRNCEDPHWYFGVTTDKVGRGRYIVLPKKLLFRRFKRWISMGTVDKLKKFPVMVVATLFDFATFMVSNHKMRKGLAIGYW